MAKASNKLTPDHIHQVSIGIAAYPSTASSTGPRRLCEHLDLWHLTNIRQLAPGERLSTLAQDSGLVHHQIRRDNQPEQFAWSKAISTGSIRKVVGVFTSDLAKQVHDAVRWIDKSIPTEEEEPVRLLSIAVLRLHGLWLVGDTLDRLIMIHSATTLRHPNFAVRTARQALPVLMRQSKSVQALPPRAPIGLGKIGPLSRVK